MDARLDGTYIKCCPWKDVDGGRREGIVLCICLTHDESDTLALGSGD